MNKLISIDLKGDFGFFRKPDMNDGINLSYNLLHKPALLGIMGAIIGLEGYKEKGKMPEYYKKLADIKIGVEPLNHEQGNFQKTVIKYSNTIGYANKGATYLTEEATLIKPSYRVYLLLDTNIAEHQKLYEYLKTGRAEYIPYFGKNEFAAWWEIDNGGFQEYDFEQRKANESFEIKTIFTKENTVVQKSREKLSEGFDLMGGVFENDAYLYFERIPKGFNTELYQYELGSFAYSTFKIKKDTTIENLYFIKNKNYYVQLI
ncbi:MAG: CRISPR-associated protein Cas5 [Bernardetiaceae bacterium]|nr:CRISPR-associated protein Cas5 [Bernardetiaceae bacterium]